MLMGLNVLTVDVVAVMEVVGLEVEEELVHVSLGEAGVQDEGSFASVELCEDVVVYALEEV